jgi:hypothetical protein
VRKFTSTICSQAPAPKLLGLCLLCGERAFARSRIWRNAYACQVHAPEIDRRIKLTLAALSYERDEAAAIRDEAATIRDEDFCPVCGVCGKLECCEE